MIQGNIDLQPNSGSADATVPISGPNGEASIKVRGTMTDGTWTYDQMDYALPNGETVNLLE